MKFLSAATCLCIALVGQIQGGSLRGLPVPLPHQTYGVPVDNNIQNEETEPSNLPNANKSEKNDISHPSDTLPLADSVGNVGKPADTYGPPTEKNEVSQPSDTFIDTLPLVDSFGNFVKPADTYGPPTLPTAIDAQKHDGPSVFPPYDSLPLVDSVVNFGKPSDTYGPPNLPTTIETQKNGDPSVFQSHVDVLPLVDSAVDFGKPSFVLPTTAKPELPYLPPGLPALPKPPVRPIIVEDFEDVNESNSGIPSPEKVETQADFVEGKPSAVYGPPGTPEVLGENKQEIPTLTEAPVIAHPTTPRGSEVPVEQDNGFKKPVKLNGHPPATEVSKDTDPEIDSLPEAHPTTPMVSEVSVEQDKDLPKPNEVHETTSTPQPTNGNEKIEIPTIHKIPALPEAPVTAHPTTPKVSDVPEEKDNGSSRPNEVNGTTKAPEVSKYAEQEIPASSEAPLTAHPTTPEQNKGFSKPNEVYGPPPTPPATNGNEKIEFPFIHKIPALPEYPITPKPTFGGVSEVPVTENNGYIYETPANGFPMKAQPTVTEASEVPVKQNSGYIYDKPANSFPMKAQPTVTEASEVPVKQNSGYIYDKPVNVFPAPNHYSTNPVNPTKPIDKPVTYPPAKETVEDFKPSAVYGPPTESVNLETSTTPSDHEKIKPNEVFGPPAGPERLEPSTTPSVHDQIKPNEVYGPPAVSESLELSTTPSGHDETKPNKVNRPPSTLEVPKDTEKNKLPIFLEIPPPPNAPTTASPTSPKVTEDPPKQTGGYNYDNPAISFPLINPSVVVPPKVHKPSQTNQFENNPPALETSQDYKPSEVYGPPAGSEQHLETSTTASAIEKVEPNEIYPRPPKAETSMKPEPAQHPFISKIRALSKIPILVKKALKESFGIKVPEVRLSSPRHQGQEVPVTARKGSSRSVFKPSYLTSTSYGAQLPVQPFILEEFVPIYQFDGQHEASPKPFGLQIPMPTDPKFFERVQLSPISEIPGPQNTLFIEDLRTVPEVPNSVGQYFYQDTANTLSKPVQTGPISSASPIIYQAYPGLLSGSNAFLSQNGRVQNTVSSSVSTSSRQVNHYTVPKTVQPYSDSIVVDEPTKNGFTIHSVTGKTENSSVKSFSQVSVVPHSSSFGTTAGQ